MRATVLIAFALFVSPFAAACNADVTDEATEDVSDASEALSYGDCDDDDDDGEADPLAVDFSNCLESIGVGLVPTAAAQALVPPGYILVGGADPVTPVVVRTAHCSKIKVGHHHGREGSIVQIGAVIVPPDFTGDINNYTFWYYTDHKDLARGLQDSGVNAQRVHHIGYHFNKNKPSGPNFHVTVPAAGISIDGRVEPSTVPAGSFDANWWKTSFASDGSVKMATDVPVINIGSADLVLTTSSNSPVNALSGGQPLGFPIIQQFNSFDTAHMDVTVQ